ncbi:MAG: hypothetical protein HY726_13825 [Candidatus Rokubacteria bacterium]|nr:hypothetical protein [Candidatus Rokubacteria bacterium]
MFDWHEYLVFATNILAAPPEPPEAAWRAAASRAYYAAHHKSREAIERRHGAEIHRDGVHAEVIRRLQERPETEATGLKLDRLRGKRAHADYNSTRAFLVSDAEIAVQLAGEVIELLRVSGEDR